MQHTFHSLERDDAWNGASASALRARARARASDGVNSNVRLTAPPVFFARGAGARLWDVDGREYVDYVLGQGPAFLGHSPGGVLDAVDAASRRGMVYGAQHPLEVEAAELFCSAVRWPDLVRFGVSGTESVQAALRLARAATGRRLYIRFEGHYHGWLDNVLLALDANGRSVPASAGQLPDYLDDGMVHSRVSEHGTALMQGVLDLARTHDLALHAQGLPMAFHVSFGESAPIHDARSLAALDRDRYARFARALATHGVWVIGRGVVRRGGAWRAGAWQRARAGRPRLCRGVRTLTARGRTPSP